MTDQHMTIYELPEFWQEKIRGLKSENRSLRMRLGKFKGCHEELPPSWAKRLDTLRRENGKYRAQRNEARAEVEALRAELEARR
ncbi:hypothetical protein [Mycolicibacterium aurum]|nr:hypothetical protein [Mycolicibacterium aurum]